MPRYYAGMTLTFNQTVRVADVLTDADDIYFKWKIGKRGIEHTETPTHDSTGTYSVSITPTEGGDLFYRWDTEGDLDVAAEGVLNIAASQFTL